eukprot:TRINITY_DN10775_c0_g1_i2.p1 TRINITY_DN10775_c0_g1~~TRINITY_DN10775_c0_g1_i2.p1  ORF type:complete len:482 (-),score=116.00 TRINITY_DN10775_c0_g1_i2:37-1422(-)
MCIRDRLNIVTMALQYEGSPPEWDSMLSTINLVFTSIFIVEAAMKLYALRFRVYWFNNWNKFDFCVVISSLVDLIMGALGTQLLSFLRAGPQLARVLRVLRVTRLLRLVKQLKELEKIILALIYSIPPMLNALALTSLVFFIFAVLAVFLFKGVTTGVMIDEYTNFQSFGVAMITLFRCATGENWPFFMYDAQRQSDVAPLFFIAQQVICSFVMLNLFVLIVNNELSKYQDLNNPLLSMGETLDAFKRQWCQSTSENNGLRISEKCIIDFFRKLGPPLGFPKGKSQFEMAKEIQALNIVCDNGYLSFNQLLFYALKMRYGNKGDFTSKSQKAYLMMEELKSRKDITEIAKKEKEKIRDEMFLKFSKANAVNPLMTLLYVRMTFKSWLKHTKDHNEKMKLAREKGEEYISEEDPEDLDLEEEEDEDGQPSENRKRDQSFYTGRSSAEESRHNSFYSLSLIHI